MDIQIYEVHRTPNRLNLNRATLRHITIKLLNVKDKERGLRAATEKRGITYMELLSDNQWISQQKPFKAREKRIT